MAKTPQVKLTIVTDYLFTAEFLRELACQVEDYGAEFSQLETYHGCAEINWPEEAYEDLEED